MSEGAPDPLEVVWRARAVRDITEIVRYIADDDPDAAHMVRLRIEEATALLGRQPSIGRQGRIDGTRELIAPGTPYVIPYRVRYGRVEILAVIHSARQWSGQV